MISAQDNIKCSLLLPYAFLNIRSIVITARDITVSTYVINVYTDPRNFSFKCYYDLCLRDLRVEISF